MPRIKHVGNEDFVAESWAKQDRSDARTKTRNMSFDGVKLFSYQTIIGEIFTNPKGEKLAVIDDTNHSHTTRGHQSAARCACNKAKLQYVKHPFYLRRGRAFMPNPDEFVRGIKDDIADMMVKETRKRNEWRKKWYADRANESIQSMRHIASFFGLPEPQMDEVFELQNQKADKIREKNAERRRLFAAWRNGEPVSLDYSAPKMMRLRNGNIEFTNDYGPYPVSEARVIVLQWLYDKGFRQPWSFFEVKQDSWRRCFGKPERKVVIDESHPLSDLIKLMVELGPEKCIKFFLKHNLIEDNGGNGVESPALNTVAV